MATYGTVKRGWLDAATRPPSGSGALITQGPRSAEPTYSREQAEEQRQRLWLRVHPVTGKTYARQAQVDRATDATEAMFRG